MGLSRSANGVSSGIEAMPASRSVMRKAARENVPVASRLLPRAVQRHLLAVYGYARLVDDIGDESAGDRLTLLDRLEADLDRVYRNDAPEHPLMRRLAPTVQACQIPPGPLRALLEANRRDQRQSSYDTYEELLGYCTLSANPVGHVVLHVFGAATSERRRLSDAICSGLQLLDHWQDVADDLARGRVYVPREDLQRFGCTHADLAAPRASSGVRELIALEVERTRELLDRGMPLIGTLSGRAAFAVAAAVAAGRAGLAAINRCGYDVLAQVPRASRREKLGALAATLADAGRTRVS